MFDRHELLDDHTTLCGIYIEDCPTASSIPIICCDCGHPECEYPMTCPVCIALVSGKVN